MELWEFMLNISGIWWKKYFFEWEIICHVKKIKTTGPTHPVSSLAPPCSQNESNSPLDFVVLHSWLLNRLMQQILPCTFAVVFNLRKTIFRKAFYFIPLPAAQFKSLFFCLSKVSKWASEASNFLLQYSPLPPNTSIPTTTLAVRTNRETWASLSLSYSSPLIISCASAEAGWAWNFPLSQATTQPEWELPPRTPGCANKQHHAGGVWLSCRRILIDCHSPPTFHELFSLINGLSEKLMKVGEDFWFR